MISLISQLRWLFSPKDKLKFTGITMLMGISALLELAGIGILAGGAAMFLSPDSAIGQDISAILAKCLPFVKTSHRIAWMIAAIGILLVLKNIFAFAIVNIQSKFIFAKRNELALRMYKCFLFADYRHFQGLAEDYCFGTISRLNEITLLVLLPAMQFAADAMVIVILTAAAIIMFPAISLAGIGFMLISAYIVVILTNRANSKAGKERLENEIIEQKFRYAGISGVKTVKASAKENVFINAFISAYTKMNLFSAKLYLLGQIPRLALESFSILLACAVFTIMILMDIPFERILITFAILTAATGRILPALSRAHYSLTQIRQNAPLLQPMCDILKNMPQEPEPCGPPANAAGIIEIKNISFAYKKNEPVFRDFSLKIQPFTSIAIAGRSGRGKTTLADLIIGLLKPDSGTITADGIPIVNDLKKWREQIGYVPQNVFLTEGSVKENVAFGESAENIDITKVKEALTLAGLNEFHPDFNISQQVNLSGGQQQRIGIARVLYRNAKLLILDEATSALDAETENNFCEVLKNLHGKATVIVISHRESTLQSCDRIINL